MKPATVQEEFIPFFFFAAADEHLFSISGYCAVVCGPVDAAQGSTDKSQILRCSSLRFTGRKTDRKREKKSKFPVCLMHDPRPTYEKRSRVENINADVKHLGF